MWFLMDLSMPGMDGIAATRAVLAVRPGTPIVILTSFAEQPRVRGAIDAGASGFLLKDSEPEALIAGVLAAARGEAPLDPRVTKALLPAAGRSEGDRLSPREREVLVLVSQGMANKQIARAMGIAERTVKVHLNSVFRQIGVSDRTSAALWARRTSAPGEARPRPHNLSGSRTTLCHSSTALTAPDHMKG